MQNRCQGIGSPSCFPRGPIFHGIPACNRAEPDSTVDSAGCTLVLGKLSPTTRSGAKHAALGSCMRGRLPDGQNFLQFPKNTRGPSLWAFLTVHGAAGSVPGTYVYFLSKISGPRRGPISQRHGSPDRAWEQCNRLNRWIPTKSIQRDPAGSQDVDHGQNPPANFSAKQLRAATVSIQATLAPRPYLFADPILHHRSKLPITNQ